MHKIGEFKTFLQLERTEKEALQSKIKDQAATIHQLTHHLKLIHASKAPPEVTANSASFLFKEGSIHVTVPPAPWENGVGSPGGSVMSAYSGAIDATSQQQHPLRSSVQNASRHTQQRESSHLYASSADYGASHQSHSRVSPQRGRRN